MQQRRGRQAVGDLGCWRQALEASGHTRMATRTRQATVLGSHPALPPLPLHAFCPTRRPLQRLRRRLQMPLHLLGSTRSAQRHRRLLLPLPAQPPRRSTFCGLIQTLSMLLRAPSLGCRRRDGSIRGTQRLPLQLQSVQLLVQLVLPPLPPHRCWPQSMS